jgi:hypothetical protein
MYEGGPSPYAGGMRDGVFGLSMTDVVLGMFLGLSAGHE